MGASDILAEASRIVTGCRQQQHGKPERSFETIAGLWGAYLDKPLTPAQVAWMMVLLKAGRSAHGESPDHALDAAGYAALAGELSETIPPVAMAS